LDAAQTPSDASVSSSYLMRAAIKWSSAVISGEVAIMGQSRAESADRTRGISLK
jgi:hypothetical protein